MLLSDMLIHTYLLTSEASWSQKLVFTRNSEMLGLVRLQMLNGSYYWAWELRQSLFASVTLCHCSHHMRKSLNQKKSGHQESTTKVRTSSEDEKSEKPRPRNRSKQAKERKQDKKVITKPSYTASKVKGTRSKQSRGENIFWECIQIQPR